MEYGVITGGSYDRVTATVDLAESGPFSLVGVADSQCLTNELYTTLGALAGATETVEIGPTMTNPVTRHPAVHASAMCNLQELTDGRAFLGLSSGDSAVRTVGSAPARLDGLERTARVVKSLSRGEPVSFDGTEMALDWLDDSRNYTVPVAMAAEGPRTLERAGRVADRVVIGLGKTPAVLESATERIDAGARAASRDPGDVDRWVFVDTNVRERREAALEEITHSLAASAHHSLQFTFEGKAVPAALESDIRRLLREYDTTVHGQPDETANRRLVEETGLREYLASRFAVVGTPAECRRQVREIADTGLIDGILFAVHTGRSHAVLEQLGSEVL